MAAHPDIAISTGFADEERAHVAALYWQSFGAKLTHVLGPKERAEAFFVQILNPKFALIARDQAGTLLGLAGLKTAEGGLLDGTFSELSRSYGWFGAVWRGAVLSVLERNLQDGVLQMDGIFVDATARGRGVGTALLSAVSDQARARGATSVQLDVIDTNPRARALYEKVGFRPVSEERTGPFKWVFGFSSATRMERPV